MRGRSKKEILQELEAQMPSYDHALNLIDAHYKYQGGMCRPVLREQLVSEILPRIYDAAWKRANPSDVDADSSDYSDEPLYAHQLAVFYAMLACGATANMCPPVHDQDASRYEQLARMALAIGAIIENTTLEVVQAVALLADYQVFANIPMGFEQIWKIFTFAIILGMDVSFIPFSTYRLLIFLCYQLRLSE